MDSDTWEAPTTHGHLHLHSDCSALKATSTVEIPASLRARTPSIPYIYCIVEIVSSIPSNLNTVATQVMECTRTLLSGGTLVSIRRECERKRIRDAASLADLVA